LEINDVKFAKILSYTEKQIVNLFFQELLFNIYNFVLIC